MGCSAWQSAYLTLLAIVIGSVNSWLRAVQNRQDFAQVPGKEACSFQLNVNLEDLELLHLSSTAREKPIWKWSQLRQGKAKRQREAGIWRHFNPQIQPFLKSSGLFRHMSQYLLCLFKSILIAICKKKKRYGMLPKTCFAHSSEHIAGTHRLIETNSPCP